MDLFTKINTYLKKEKIYSLMIGFLLIGYFIIIPLIFDTSAKSNFSTPKLLSLRIITLLILLLFGIRTYFEKKISYRKTIINILFIIFGIISIFSTFSSVNIYSSLYGYPGIFFSIFALLNLLLIYYIFSHLIENENIIIKILNISVAVALIVSIYGILQYLKIIDVSNFSQSETGRIFSTIGHANHLGAYLGMNILIGLGLFFYNFMQKAKKLNLLFYFISIGLFFLSLILTASRGALISTIIALIFFLILSLVFLYPRIINKKRFGLISVLIGIVLFLGFTIGYPQIAALNIVQRTNETIGLIKEGHNPDRLSWALSSLEMIKDKPLLGFGLSTFSDIYNKYRRSDYLVPGDIQDEITPENPHNEYLAIAVEMGLPALLIFLTIIIILFYKTIKTFLKYKKNNLNLILLGILGGILVYLLQVMVSFGVIASQTIFYSLLGLLTALNSIINNEKVQFVNLNQKFKISLFVLIIIIFLYGSFYSITQYSSEVFLKRAIKAGSRGNFLESITNYEIANKLMPNNYYYYSLQGNSALSAYSATQDRNYFNTAIESYKTAIGINDFHPSSYANLAMLYYNLYIQNEDKDNFNLFEKNFENAILLSPNNPLYLYKYGEMLNSLEKSSEAKKQFEKVSEIREGYKNTDEYLKD